MKTLILTLLITTTISLNALTPVNGVDDQKFSGLWYEVARTYNDYQEKCVASSVEYLLVEPLKYKVFNRCFETKIGGKLIEYEGTANSVDGKSMSSIDMTYFWIFTKSYHVYYLDDGYNYAVVANDTFDQVWIMSRKPTMPQNILNEIKEKLSTVMELKNLIYTPQDAQGRYQ